MSSFPDSKRTPQAKSAAMARRAIQHARWSDKAATDRNVKMLTKAVAR